MNVVFLGAGIGAIILSVLWTFALLSCFISLRTKYNLGPLAIAVSFFITVVLLSVPRGADTPFADKSKTKILDPLFVWRTSILLFLGLSAIIGTSFLIMAKLTEVKQARPMKHWYLQS